MARTRKLKAEKPWSKEKSWARLMVTRKERARVRDLLAHERHDEVSGRLTKGTQGWHSW